MHTIAELRRNGHIAYLNFNFDLFSAIIMNLILHQLQSRKMISDLISIQTSSHISDARFWFWIEMILAVIFRSTAWQMLLGCIPCDGHCNHWGNVYRWWNVLISPHRRILRSIVLAFVSSFVTCKFHLHRATTEPWWYRLVMRWTVDLIYRQLDILDKCPSVQK